MADISVPGALEKFVASPERCNLVQATHDYTGLRRPTHFGWWQGRTVGDSAWDVAFNEGRLYRGCTVSAQTLRVTTGYNSVFEMDLDSTPPAARELIIGDVKVSVAVRGADTDRADRTVLLHVASRWFSGRSVVPAVITTVSAPPGLSLADCESEPGSHRRTIYSEPYLSQFWLFGGKGDRLVGTTDGTANGAIALPTGCVLETSPSFTGVTGRELWFEGHAAHNGPVPLVDVIDHGNHGYTITKPSGSTSLLANIHWWQDPLHKISLRAAWVLQEADGTDCVTAINTGLPQPVVVGNP